MCEEEKCNNKCRVQDRLQIRMWHKVLEITTVSLCDITRAKFTSTIRFSWIRWSLRCSGPCNKLDCSPASGAAPSLSTGHKNTQSLVFLVLIMTFLNCIFHALHPYFRVFSVLMYDYHWSFSNSLGGTLNLWCMFFLFCIILKTEALRSRYVQKTQ